MVSPTTRTHPHRAVRRQPSEPRFDRQLGKILDHATEVFCDKGYEGASMRDLSRATGMSLAGMYHYFGSKERLLYLIQEHTFSTILSQLRDRLAKRRQGIPGSVESVANCSEPFRCLCRQQPR